MKTTINLELRFCFEESVRNSLFRLLIKRTNVILENINKHLQFIIIRSRVHCYISGKILKKKTTKSQPIQTTRT